METVEDEETKRGKRILEMVSLWVCHTIRTSSSSFDPILYELLPYMCQFIGTIPSAFIFYCKNIDALFPVESSKFGLYQVVPLIL